MKHIQGLDVLCKDCISVIYYSDEYCCNDYLLIKVSSALIDNSNWNSLLTWMEAVGFYQLAWHFVVVFENQKQQALIKKEEVYEQNGAHLLGHE